MAQPITQECKETVNVLTYMQFSSKKQISQRLGANSSDPSSV